MSEFQINSESINTFSISRYLIKIVTALVFGAMFCYLQEIVQPHLAGKLDGFCCERCSNILYDQALSIYAVCAGIGFFPPIEIEKGQGKKNDSGTNGVNRLRLIVKDI